MKRALVVISALLMAGVAAAQDGIYAPVLPDDIALVRVINVTGVEPGAGTGGGEPVTIDVGTTRIGPIPAGAGSLYYPVRPGVYVVFAAGSREPLTAGPRTFQTVVITTDRISIIEDAHHDDPLRAQLILYNAASVSLRLDAVVPSAALIDSVKPGESGVVAINAIPVSFAVSAVDAPASTADPCGCADTSPAILPLARFDSQIDLTRGDSFAIVVTERELKLEGFVVMAGVATGDE